MPTNWVKYEKNFEDKTTKIITNKLKYQTIRPEISEITAVNILFTSAYKVKGPILILRFFSIHHDKLINLFGTLGKLPFSANLKKKKLSPIFILTFKIRKTDFTELSVFLNSLAQLPLLDPSKGSKSNFCEISAEIQNFIFNQPKIDLIFNDYIGEAAYFPDNSNISIPLDQQTKPFSPNSNNFNNLPLNQVSFFDFSYKTQGPNFVYENPGIKKRKPINRKNDGPKKCQKTDSSPIEINNNCSPEQIITHNAPQESVMIYSAPQHSFINSQSPTDSLNQQRNVLTSTNLCNSNLNFFPFPSYENNKPVPSLMRPSLTEFAGISLLQHQHNDSQIESSAIYGTQYPLHPMLFAQQMQRAKPNMLNPSEINYPYNAQQLQRAKPPYNAQQ
ncbi:MAG: hypothetical protein K2Q14_01330 [Gammaproteobacteria bacterium]|nr:hypothetical protein [Gammaproteobacteria bacterium]